MLSAYLNVGICNILESTSNSNQRQILHVMTKKQTCAIKIFCYNFLLKMVFVALRLTQNTSIELQYFPSLKILSILLSHL